MRLEGIRKGFGDRMALKGVSLTISRGEILGIMGPSGAGKTTLLRVIGLLERPDSGRLLFDGIDPSGDEERLLALRRRMGFVFQEGVAFRGSVLENCMYPLVIRGLKGEAAKSRAWEILKRVGLEGVGGRDARTLSAGELQRLALARALVYSPELLLLDEPTANLDPTNVKLIEEMVMRLGRECGATIVWVTHNVFQARRVSEKVALLLEGQLIAHGSTEEVLNRPKDPRAEAFIKGDMVF